MAVSRILQEGRLRRVGKKVDVRSIAAYIENPEQVNFEAKARKGASLSSQRGHVPRRGEGWALGGRPISRNASGDTPEALENAKQACKEHYLYGREITMSAISMIRFLFCRSTMLPARKRKKMVGRKVHTVSRVTLDAVPL